MVTLNLGEIEFDTKADIVNTLNEIQNAIENGCTKNRDKIRKDLE